MNLLGELTYDDIEGLPKTHPKVKQFMGEVEAWDNFLDEAYKDGSPHHDFESEGSLSEFNLVIAGDRRL